jgi:hypothetical protein
MDDAERQELAEGRAEAYAPAPAGGSAMAGLCLAAVAIVGSVVVFGFYGWRAQDHLLVVALLATGGFLIGLLAHKRLARANRRAMRTERRRIDNEQSLPRAAQGR